MSDVPNDSPAAKSNRAPSVLLRAIAMILAVIVAAPATAGVVWMIHQHYLREKYSREGLPPDAPLDRNMLELREENRNAPANGRNYSFAYLAQRLDFSAQDNRKISPQEWFFYCGPPDLMKRSSGTIQYLYTARPNDVQPAEVLLTMDESSPHIVSQSEVRMLQRASSGVPNGSAAPFAREGFVPYQPER